MGRIVNDNLISVYQRTLRGAAQLEFFESGIPQLQGVLETADRCGHRHHIAHGNGPAAVLILGYHSFVKLNGITGIIPEGDVGTAEGTIFVVDLSHRQVSDGDIGTDICCGQSTDGGGLGLQGHTGGLFISAVVQLRQAVVGSSGTGGNDRIAQRDVREVCRHSGADTAGGVLKIDILPVQKSYNTLDCQVSRSISRCQSLGDGNGFGLIRRCYLAAVTAIGYLEYQQVKNILIRLRCIRKGISAKPPSVANLPGNGSCSRSRCHKAECSVSIVLNYPSICFVRLCKVCSGGTIS